jgi:D-alanyl-D-alanine carboxypeptidase
VIALVQKGDAQPRVYRAGVSDRTRRKPPRATDFMRLASVSKAYEGAVAMSLVDKGELSLDATVGALAPGTPVAWAPITLRQLLQHTSGIPAYTTSKSFLRTLAANPRGAFTHQQLIEAVASQPLSFPPGSKYFYSNTENIVAGLMIETATGKTYEDALQAEVYEPLGLTRTSLPPGFAMPQPAIHGYDGRDDVTTAISTSGVWASGGMISTPLELGDFIRGDVGFKLFSEITADAQRQFVAGSSDPPGPGRNAAGLALFRYSTRCGTMFGHTGSFPGYTQFAAASEDGTRSVTVSANTQLSPDEKPTIWRKLRKAEEQAVCKAFGK